MRLSRSRSGLALLLAIATSGLLALAFAEDRAGTDAVRWRQHDIRRPRPPVVEPSESGGSIASSPPRDAVVVFNGTNLDAWQSADGTPARWRVADGCLETVPGQGRSRRSGGSATFRFTSNGPRRARPGASARTAAIAEFS